MADYFGIDFGTTNSAVVWYDRGEHFARFVDVGDEDGNPYRSVVAIDNLTLEVTSGLRVKERIISLREGSRHLVVESVKSALDTDAFWPTPAKIWDAEAIAAELFRALSARAAELAGTPVRQAVVAIPIGMTPAKRAVIRRAARKAGIEITNFVSEPTAAFIAHAKELKHCRYVVVFDWGGGTLDISVLENRRGCIVERHTDGSDKAGDDIDRRLAEWVHTRIAETRHLNLSFENVAPREKQILLNQAEQCKCKLQIDGASSQKIVLGHYAGIPNIEQVVTPDEFNALVKPVVDEAMDKLIGCVRDARISEEQVGKLIVVGGTSKLQALQRELRRRWARPNVIFPPGADWSIARGCAWLAAHPGGDRIAESVGLVLADGEYHPIFPTGTQLEHSQFNLGFGLVEDAPTAIFDFATRDGADSRPHHVGKLQVKTFGFRDEVIELDTQITQDLVLEAIASNQRTSSPPERFTYDKLKWMYQVPEDF